MISIILTDHVAGNGSWLSLQGNTVASDPRAGGATLRLPAPGVAAWLAEHAEDASGALVFCLQNGILADAKAALDLAEECFQAASFTFRLRREPEGGEEKLVLRVSTRSEIKVALAAYDQFVTTWLTVAQPQARNLLRLSYTLV